MRHFIWNKGDVQLRHAHAHLSQATRRKRAFLVSITSPYAVSWLCARCACQHLSFRILLKIPKNSRRLARLENPDIAPVKSNSAQDPCYWRLCATHRILRTGKRDERSVENEMLL